jgi:hypothetical protein
MTRSDGLTERNFQNFPLPEKTSLVHHNCCYVMVKRANLGLGSSSAVKSPAVRNEEAEAGCGE